LNQYKNLSVKNKEIFKIPIAKFLKYGLNKISFKFLPL